MLVLEQPSDVAEAARQLIRIGYEQVEGYLAGGIEAWLAQDEPVVHMPHIPMHELREALGCDGEVPWRDNVALICGSGYRFSVGTTIAAGAAIASRRDGISSPSPWQHSGWWPPGAAGTATPLGAGPPAVTLGMAILTLNLAVIVAVAALAGLSSRRHR